MPILTKNIISTTSYKRTKDKKYCIIIILQQIIIPHLRLSFRELEVTAILLAELALDHASWNSRAIQTVRFYHFRYL